MGEKLNKFKRTVSQLEGLASLWWSEEIDDLVSRSSPFSILQKTHSCFIDLLSSNYNTPDALFDLVENSSLSPNLFLKHLTLLADFGGEKFQRINKQFDTLFDYDKSENKFFLRNKFKSVESKIFFEILPMKGNLTNISLKIDNRQIGESFKFLPVMRDAAVLLLFGGTENNNDALLKNCNLSRFSNEKDKLEEFCQTRYLSVSRITGGAEANEGGQALQHIAARKIKEIISNEFIVKSPGKMVIDGYDRKHKPFDIIVSKKGSDRSVGVEVSFQVTTNSTIERKANEAEKTYEMVKGMGNYLAYIIDGAGNFQRKSAVSTLCSNSDCNIAYTNQEISVLVKFIEQVLS